MARISALTFACFVFILPAAAVGADEPASNEATIGQQLAQVNASLQQIVTLLQRQIEGDETSLLIKRVELSNRNLTAKKDRLRKLRDEAANQQEKELSLSGALEATEEQLAGELDVEPAQQIMMEQMEERIKSVARRRQDLERELVVLENEVRIEEEDMEVLEAVLDDRLGLR
ncbi:MAG: hypothetical protein AAF657_28215 [Acidobacteriota bacterium]